MICFETNLVMGTSKLSQSVCLYTGNRVVVWRWYNLPICESGRDWKEEGWFCCIAPEPLWFYKSPLLSPPCLPSTKTLFFSLVYSTPTSRFIYLISICVCTHISGNENGFDACACTVCRYACMHVCFMYACMYIHHHHHPPTHQPSITLCLTHTHAELNITGLGVSYLEGERE